MSYKSVLNSKRVFKDPGNIIIESVLDVTISLSEIVTTITCVSTENFSESGYVSIGSEVFYYSGKNGNQLIGVTRAVDGTTAALHLSGSSLVIQNRPSPTDATPSNSNLAGWYINGYSNQASLRVFDSPVIQQGVIRFNPATNVFQGCTSTSPTITWATFNATQGPPGSPGIINALLTFDNVTNPGTLTSNIGEIIKTITIDTQDDPVPPIEVRTIVSGNTSVNGNIYDTLLVSQTSNEIICNPQPRPFTWSLLDTISALKNWDTNTHSAYSWANTAQFPVEAGNEPVAGQVVVSFISSPSNLLCVKPLSFTSTSNLNPLKVSPPFPPNLGIVGVCINNPSVTTPAIIAMNGITQISMSDNASPYTGMNTSAEIPYSGKICLVNQNGFGINAGSIVTPPYIQIGTFLETTNSLTNGSNVIIRLDPKIITNNLPP